MRKPIATTLLLVLILSFALSGCKSQSNTPAPTSSQPVETQAATATTAQNDDVWALKGWEAAPVSWGEPWGNLPKLSVEYTYRTTPADVTRTLDGNFYAQGWPIVKDKETLKVFMPESPLLDMSTNFVITNLEKKTNIHIEWITAPRDSATEKRNIIISSGDLPDMFMGSNFSKNDDSMFGASQKLFVPLTPYINTIGYYFPQMLKDRPEMKRELTCADGNIYSFASVFTDYYDLYDQKGWINKAWLDKLGLKVPTTTDEYYDALVAFKTKDPNGNGKADEMPLIGTKEGGGWYTAVQHFFMNPFVLNSQSEMVVENGKVSYAPATPGYREGLKWFEKLYKAGLLDKDSFVRGDQQMVQLGQNPGDEIVGSFAGGYYGCLTGDVAGPRVADYTALPPLKGPSGNAYAEIMSPQYSYGQGEITNACKDPKAAFRWMEWFYSPEAAMAMWAGRLGTEWVYPDAGEKGIFSDKPTFKQLIENDWGKPTNYALFDANFPTYYMKLDKVDPVGYTTKMTAWTKDLYEGHEMKENYPRNPQIDASILEDNITTGTNLKTYTDEAFAKFVLGELDANKDADWNNYLAQLDKIGLQKYLQEQQKTYDEYISIK